VISLISIFLQIRDFFCYAKHLLLEAFVWLATFLFTVFLAVDLGLLVGLAVSLLFPISWMVKNKDHWANSAPGPVF
jgi:MFS superfamily sulfate permease-like transporter